MKILYCIPTLDHGGAERQLSYLAAQLASSGHGVHVASRGGGPNLDRMLRAGVVWHPLSSTERYKRRNLFGLGRLIRASGVFFRLVALIRTLKPDLVQTILAPMDILGGAAALLTRTPWVLKEGSSALIYTTYPRYWLRFAFGRLSDAVVSNSTHGYDYWRPVRETSALHMIRNGLPLTEIADATVNEIKGFKFRPDERVVLYAGRIDIGKNVGALIAALSRMRDELPFTAVICGDGARRHQVERMAGELGIADRVIFTGYLDNLWGLMKRADVFVTMSRCEGCPNIVLEAMACGCPLVVSDIPAHRELLDDDMALFVDSEDSKEAANAIAEVLQHSDRTTARARAAQATAAEWTVEATGRQYEQVYLRLLSGASDLRDFPIVTSTEPAQANER